MKLSDSPCMNCRNRRQGCHQLCESFIAWKKRREEERAEARQERLMIDYEICRAKKWKKWRDEHKA